MLFRSVSLDTVLLLLRFARHRFSLILPMDDTAFSLTMATDEEENKRDAAGAREDSSCRVTGMGTGERHGVQAIT